jgi:hypothetical protein
VLPIKSLKSFWPLAEAHVGGPTGVLRRHRGPASSRGLRRASPRGSRGRTGSFTPSRPLPDQKGFIASATTGYYASADCKSNIARTKELMAAPTPEVDPPVAQDTVDPHTGANIVRRAPSLRLGAGRENAVKKPSPRASGRGRTPRSGRVRGTAYHAGEAVSASARAFAKLAETAAAN